jgi:hypothetical protein
MIAGWFSVQKWLIILSKYLNDFYGLSKDIFTFWNIFEANKYLSMNLTSNM